MTDSLRELLDDRAGAVPSATVDVSAVVAAGDRRLRRRRAGSVAAVAVLAVAVTTLGLSRTGGVGGLDGDGPVAGRGAGSFTEHRPTYGVGSVIHYGTASIDTGRRIGSFVQTDDGFVVTSSDGRVHLADGRRTATIGRTSKDGLYLAADDSGSLAAWVEFDGGRAPQLVVYDTGRRAEVLRTAEGTRTGMTAFRDTDSVYVAAVDDGTVYWRNARGIVATDVADGSSRVLSPDGGPFDLEDVAAGVFAHKNTDSDGNGSRLAISTALDRPGRELPTGWTGDLSPSARYVAVEEADKVAVYDARTRAVVTPRTPAYQFVSPYAWIDDTTLSMVGIKRLGSGPQPIDILTCRVDRRTCSVEAPGVTTYDESGPITFSVPTGEKIG